MSAVRIRVTGDRAEITAVIAAITDAVMVREVSDFYPNRGSSTLGRLYLDVVVPSERVGSVAPSSGQPDTADGAALEVDLTVRQWEKVARIATARVDDGLPCPLVGPLPPPLASAYDHGWRDALTSFGRWAQFQAARVAAGR